MIVMPPRPKFKKDEIISAALNITAEKGIAGLTAQELKTALGCSASPIFTVFDSMKEIHDEVRISAMCRFENYTVNFESDMPIFKQIGMKMIMFGMNEPKLYQLLFMQENEGNATFDGIFGVLGKTAKMCIETIEKDYNLDTESAKTLFENVWIYTFGIGTLCAVRVCRFSEEKISEMLTRNFTAAMLLVKSEKKIERND